MKLLFAALSRSNSNLAERQLKFTAQIKPRYRARTTGIEITRLRKRHRNLFTKHTWLAFVFFARRSETLSSVSLFRDVGALDRDEVSIFARSTSCRGFRLFSGTTAGRSALDGLSLMGKVPMELPTVGVVERATLHEMPSSTRKIPARYDLGSNPK